MKAKAGPEGMGFMRACPTILSAKMAAFKHLHVHQPQTDRSGADKPADAGLLWDRLTCSMQMKGEAPYAVLSCIG